jgi:SAM-dependent methyltransferase
VINVAKSYGDHLLHVEVGEIIRAHSENRTDIRSVARRLIVWNGIRRIMDLGCGYGWFEDVLEGSFDLIAGIDCLGENGPPFIRSAKKTAREAIFKMVTLPATTDFPSDYFDLIVSAYSLYFFPGALPEIKRLLRPGGIFVVITHSESMLEEGERYFDFKDLRKVIENFSAENGKAILKKYFVDIASIDYTNTLVFRKGEGKDLARYIDFKREFIKKDVDPDLVRAKMLQELLKNGEVRLNKNDRVFLVKK